MSNIAYPRNLLALRQKLNLNQEQLGDILGVSTRMVCNYEIGKITLPINKAILLCKKYNCTLDWLYRYPASAKVSVSTSCQAEEYPKFIVDIRDFLSYSGNSLFLTIPMYYWEYMQKRNAISLNSLSEEKTRKIAELDGSYQIRKNEQKYWCLPIAAQDFLSYLRLDSKFVPFAETSNGNTKEPSKEQIEEAISFLEILSELTNDL